MYTHKVKKHTHTHTHTHTRHLGSQLAEMERAIERMMEADLVDFTRKDIGLRLKAISNPSFNSDVNASEVLYIYISQTHRFLSNQDTFSGVQCLCRSFMYVRLTK